MNSASTSRSLIVRVQDNEEGAWDQLVTLYAPLLLHWLRSFGLRQEDVEDLFQEVFQAAARSLPEFRKERREDTFRGWLRTITRNKVNDLYRRQSREERGVGGSVMQAVIQELPVDAADSTASSVVEGPERQLLRHALALVRQRCTEQSWQAFVRTVLDGQSATQVGDELNMKPGAVRVAKARVLQRLRAELGDLPSA
jgi:RNA polymerase sigma-70 factor (ECF subfamily)